MTQNSIVISEAQSIKNFFKSQLMHSGFFLGALVVAVPFAYPFLHKG